MTAAASHDDPTGPHVVLGVVWQDGVPLLRIRAIDQSTSRLTPVAAYRLGYRVRTVAERACLGHVPFRTGSGDFHDCLNAPRPGSRHCERCAIVEATFASNLHHAHRKGSAELDASVREHLAQPNRLYLAAFRDGSIKIGTSTLNRSDKRLQEQGAWMARIVAETTNGRTVRHLEDAVTERLDIQQAVSGVRKRRGLVSPMADDELAARLEQAAADVRTAVLGPTTHGHEVELLDQLWRHPMADHPATQHVLDYPLPLNTGRHDLHLITAIGRTLLATRSDGNDVFAIDPAPLLGIWLDMGDYGSDEIAIQDSLF